MLGIDILDAFEALETVPCAREERSRLKQIGEAACNRRHLKRVVIGEEFWNDIDSLRGYIAGSDQQIKQNRQGVRRLFLVPDGIQSDQAKFILRRDRRELDDSL